MRLTLPLATLILGFLGGALAHRVLQNSDTDEMGQQEVSLPGLGEVTGRNYTFAQVIEETSGRKVLPASANHSSFLNLIRKVANEVGIEMSQPNSPARSHRRINEVSADFEEALRRQLGAHPDLECDFPITRNGRSQRAGYPDLFVRHLPSGTVAYLDPKLFEEKSIRSSFRSFYYKPAGESSKVTEDALHLLLGYPHNGRVGAWSFGSPKLVDLSNLTVTLKTEFSASNKELYGGLTEPE